MENDRGLTLNTSWKTDSGYKYDGHNYYRVGSGMYIIDSDVVITK